MRLYHALLILGSGVAVLADDKSKRQTVEEAGGILDGDAATSSSTSRRPGGTPNNVRPGSNLDAGRYLDSERPGHFLDGRSPQQEPAQTDNLNLDARDAVDSEEASLETRHGYVDDCKYAGPGECVPDPKSFFVPGSNCDEGNCWDMCLDDYNCQTTSKICLDFQGQAVVATIYPPYGNYQLIDASITLENGQQVCEDSPQYTWGHGDCQPRGSAVVCRIPYFRITNGGSVGAMCPMGSGKAWVFNIVACAQVRCNGNVHTMYSRPLMNGQIHYSVSYYCASCQNDCNDCQHDPSNCHHDSSDCCADCCDKGHHHHHTDVVTVASPCPTETVVVTQLPVTITPPPATTTTTSSEAINTTTTTTTSAFCTPTGCALDGDAWGYSDDYETQEIDARQLSTLVPTVGDVCDKSGYFMRFAAADFEQRLSVFGDGRITGDLLIPDATLNHCAAEKFGDFVLLYDENSLTSPYTIELRYNTGYSIQRVSGYLECDTSGVTLDILGGPVDVDSALAIPIGLPAVDLSVTGNICEPAPWYPSDESVDFVALADVDPTLLTTIANALLLDTTDPVALADLLAALRPSTPFSTNDVSLDTIPLLTSPSGGPCDFYYLAIFADITANANTCPAPPAGAAFARRH